MWALDSPKAKKIKGLTVRAKVNGAISDGAPDVVGNSIEEIVFNARECDEARNKYYLMGRL